MPTARKPAKAVTGAQLHRMLRHPYYKGVISFQGVEYAGAHEPLVDEETWSQVQAVLDSHRFGERERQHNHHLKNDGVLRPLRCPPLSAKHTQQQRRPLPLLHLCQAPTNPRLLLPRRPDRRPSKSG